MNLLLSKLFDAKRILKNKEILGDLPSDRALLGRTLQVAWPSMLESFLVALVGFIDTIMVGTLGDYAIAAVGLTNQPRMLCLSVFMAISTAVSALVARRKGEQDRASAIRVLKIALILTLFFVGTISTLAVVFAPEIIRFAGAQADTQEFAVAYFRIIAGGLAFNVLSMVINAAQRGSGNTKIAMTTNMTSNAVNVVFNYLLIGGNFGFPALGVRGAAIATVLGTAVSFAMSVASVCHPDGYIYILHKTGIRDSRSVRSIANIGSSTMLEQVFLRIGFFTYAKIMASLGTVAFSTHQIAMNILTISFSFGDGLSVAAVALVGYSLGEKRSDLAIAYGSFCQRCGFLCSAALSIIYIFFGRYVFTLFSDTPQVVSDGAILMKIMTVVVLFQISQLIYSGCLRGSGDTRYTAFVSFVNIAILRPLLAYLMAIHLGFGLIGAWAGLAIDQSLRLVMTAIRFQRGKWMKLKI